MTRFALTAAVLASILLAQPAALLAQPAAEGWSVASPDGRLTLTVLPGEDGRLLWQVERGGRTVLRQSPLGLRLEGDGGDFTGGLSFVSREDARIDETFPILAGGQATSVNRANEATLTFRNAPGRELQLVVRAYDDGVAFRYRVPGDGYAVTEELTGYALPAEATTWAQPWRNNYEAEYRQQSLGALANGAWGHPVLVSLPGGTWALLTEAWVTGRYAALHFRGSGRGGEVGDGLLTLTFPPDQRGPIIGDGALETPWRVVMAADGLGPIVTSTLMLNLNPPSRIEDTSWIRPGRVAWSWWADHASPRSYDAQVRYVDFASEMGWEYVLVDEGWPQWRDRMPELIRYAAERNVGVLLWRHARGFSEEEARLWKSWGAAGVKLDFIDSDSQRAFRESYDREMELTARHQLLLNFHGSTKPGGESRTWPHLMTREGVKGGEYRDMRSAENINLVFTRNVLGPMDYTPVQLSHTRNTFANQVAQAVLFQSDLQHFVDTPENYRRSPAKPFLQAVPAAWDETRFVAGMPDRFVCLARRSGRQWYVGANTAEPIQYPLRLEFLDPGTTYEAHVYRDAEEGQELVAETREVTRDDVLRLSLQRNGGFAVRFVPK